MSTAADSLTLTTHIPYFTSAHVDCSFDLNTNTYRVHPLAFHPLFFLSLHHESNGASRDSQSALLSLSLVDVAGDALNKACTCSSFHAMIISERLPPGLSACRSDGAFAIVHRDLLPLIQTLSHHLSTSASDHQLDAG